MHPSDSAPRRRTRSGPCPRWQEGCGLWRPPATPDAGAAGAAFPRWSVGTIKCCQVAEVPGCTVYIVIHNARPCCRGEKFFAPTHPAQVIANGAHGAPYPRTCVTGCCSVGRAVRTTMVPPADGRWGGGLPRAARHGHGWCGGGVGMVPRRRLRRARHLPRGE